MWYQIKNDTILFFDMDGTLIDTNFANFLSYKKAIEFVTNTDYGLSYYPDKRFNRSQLKKAIPNLNEKELDKIVHIKELYYNDYLHETRLNVKISNILCKYSKTNTTVLVTNCRKERALATLKYHKLNDHFTHAFFSESNIVGVKTNKYNNAIVKLGVSPSLVVAFENEDVEIFNAIQAGIPSQNIIHI